MRAAPMKNWQMRVDDVPMPSPGPGQVLARVRASGVCGSDRDVLTFGASTQHLVGPSESVPTDSARPQPFDPARDVIMGHEICAEVVELGADVSNLSVGDVVVSVPVAFDHTGTHAVGFSDRYPGGYGEFVVLNELIALKVPNGLEPRLACLTEPLAVGVHAVAKARIEPDEGAVVLGLGPVGLACVAALRLANIGPIVGSDPSPTRRALAQRLGCDAVVDPTTDHPMSTWRNVASGRTPVVFEAVGQRGMIDEAMVMSPRDSRIVIVGSCMQPDEIHPIVGVTREQSLHFVVSYEPAEFSTALRAIAEGTVEFGQIITGSIAIDEIPDTLDALATPGNHAKIIVEPK